jgi:hypothetical protein
MAQQGSTMTLRSRIGPVTIERPVTLLQPGRDRRSVFVRDSDGQVYTAPVALDQSE